MSLQYNEIYDISNGIFRTFKSSIKSKKIYLNINHKQDKRDKMKPFYFKCNIFNSWTRGNFILANMLVNFKYSPSSIEGVLEKLPSITKKDIYDFKNEITYYDKFLTEDLKYMDLNDREAKTNILKLTDLVISGNIKWFTLYFFMLATDNIKYLNEPINSIMYEHTIMKIRKMILFVKFKSASIDKIIKEINTKHIKID